MSRLNGCTQPNTTSILVEGVPFSTVSKTTSLPNEISTHWKQNVPPRHVAHPHQLQGNNLDNDCSETSSEVSSHITAMESAKA